jgi:4-carboxymuconolactone decarboxylase
LTRRHDQNGSIEQLRGHLGRARQNGLTETELKEMIIHLACYAGWPRAMSAISLAQELFDGGDAQ